MTESGAHLTTSRVNRLLRPLRNKCNSLAVLAKTTAASRVTYSKHSSNWDPDSRPPLAMLCLSSATKKLTLEKHSADEFELARRINAVCDAFKNVAHVAFGLSCNERIPSLAAMCALVVGETMHPDNVLADSGEPPIDDILDVDGIYEAVPPHYRRFLIVSHALSMILSICTHHHSLLTILLDHCLALGLVYESTHLLSIIFARALLPHNPSYPSPIMHPSHTNYLLDLHTKWTAANKRAGSSDTVLFTTSTFCQMVLGKMSQSSPCISQTLWTSKVLNKLLHVVESCDVDSYISIIHALSQNFWETTGSSPDAMQDNAQVGMLKDKLSEMMSNLFDLLFSRHDSNSTPLTPSRIKAAIDILHDCYVARLHRLRISISSSPNDLPDMIIIFTTHIFVTFQNSVDNPDGLLAILDDSSPVPTTFSKLMVYLTRFQEGRAFGDLAEAFLSELKLYSSAFCSEKLFRLDASLWACGLHHFETSMATFQKGSSALMMRYKRQLMEAVDVAERRCFGDMNSSPVVSSSNSSTCARRRTHYTRTSGHWEWEDMVGSWIRKTPVHKKRKIENPHTPPRQRGAMVSNAVLSTSISPPSLTHHRRSSTFSSSSYSLFSDPESRLEDGSEYQEETDKENYPRDSPQVVGRSRRIKRRSSNFLSLLADAQMNRIVLHSKPRTEPNPPSSVIPRKYVIPLSSQESRHGVHRQGQDICYRKTSPRATPPPRAILLSDDSLDLFAYATTSSSPPRC